MKLDKVEITQVIRALYEDGSPPGAAVATSSFLSRLRRQMDDYDMAQITAVIQMDDTELLAAIGRIVVEAAVLEYTVAVLVAV